jgi:antitoxin component YwqK of YwqJK toxin-antitoxin module
MKIQFILGVFFLVMASCSEKPVEEESQVETYRPLIEVKDGVYTEWYPGHKQVKIKGRQTDAGERDGIWKHYTENGFEAAVTVYNNGKKDGHIVVYHPNGALYYRGEYRKDEQVGLWSFYDEEGNLVEEINYDTLPKAE